MLELGMKGEQQAWGQNLGPRHRPTDSVLHLSANTKMLKVGQFFSLHIVDEKKERKMV